MADTSSVSSYRTGNSLPLPGEKLRIVVARCGLRWSALAMAAILALASGLTSAGADSESNSGALIRSIDPDTMRHLLAGAGYGVDAEAPPILRVRSPNGTQMFVELTGCGSDGCAGVRVRARWVLGDRPDAIRAARYYEEIVPIAFVSFARIDQGTLLLAGRDMRLTPGRTTENLLFQIDQVDRMAGAITSMLMREDPGIAEYWQALRRSAQ